MSSRYWHANGGAVNPQVLAAFTRTALTEVAASNSAEDSSTHCVGLLKHLAKVPRFDMAAMCLPARDKAALGALWDAAAERLAAAQGEGDDDMASLRRAYKL